LLEDALQALEQSDLYELQKTRTLFEIQEEVLGWLKIRLGLFALIVAAIGFFGVRSLVREMVSNQLSEATRAAAKAEASAEQARDASQRTLVQIDQSASALRGFQVQSDELEQRLEELKEKLESSRKRFEASASNAIAKANLDVSNIEEKVENLTSTVEQLARLSEKSEGVLERFEESLRRIESEAEKQRESFLQNSDYTIEITEGRGYQSKELEMLKGKLSGEGFKVTGSVWWKDFKPSQEVVIDRRSHVPESVAQHIDSIIRDAYAKTSRNVPNILHKAQDATWQLDKNDYVWVYWSDLEEVAPSVE